MRPALLCVFFTLIIRRETIHAQNDDFRPTPIPLIEWHHDRRDGRAGTLHETFKTASPPTVAAVPAHYWEDALRHSVYLTLVRDKIDQLIAKGDVISPNSKPNGYDSKEIDDHNLWDKIKTAPFDRIPEEELSSFGDVTIMAKGRLLEQNGGYRFAEDERTKEKCSADNCMQNVKAFWSVKRVRQRDLETSPGKYHYELTFSVISQTPKKQRKPYENPIRTFTVKESTPIQVTERQVHTSRPQRAIWVHKNIAPSKFVGRQQYFPGLDRIFSSLFSDDEDQSYDSPLTKYKQSPYPPPSGSQYSKIGQAGTPIDQHQQIPYPYRPQQNQVKLIRLPLQAPPTSSNQYQYQDFASVTTTNSIPYAHYPYDHRVESNQVVKTTRPAVLPTPLPPILPPKDQSAEVTNTMSMEQYNSTVSDIKTHKVYNKYKNTPVKVNYFSDHVRPPVFNAPPGVFVTMDKKPFKPMPPLKMMHSKQHRTNKPIDFRPSPQILDQPIDHDSFSDTAFRPITMKYSDNTSTEKDVITAYRKNENKIRKSTTSSKKPFKKHDSVKSNHITTNTPDIITASSSGEEIETMDWANVLGSFTKTTPMVSQTEKITKAETTTPMTTTTTITPVTLITTKKKLITTTEPVQENVTSTTIKPKRRTRPPPKFVKQEKIKKHKRITTTTSTTTTNAPENSIKRRPIHDLTPLASSAPTGTIKFSREPNNSTTSTTTTTTTTTTTPTTTARPITIKTTTTTQEPSTTTTIKPITSTTQPKNKNRFRQSTLMYKGTSVKHDRWNVSGMSKNQTSITSQLPLTSLHRRKGSNFQGYISSTTARYIDEEKEQERESHTDRKISSVTEKVAIIPEINLETDSPDEESESKYESNSVLPLEKSEEVNDDNRSEDESNDHSEYIFQSTTSESTKIEENSSLKNKSKCKKKKQNPSTTEDSTLIDFETPRTTTLATIFTTTKTTTEKTASTENDILENLFNYNFSEDDKTRRTELKEEESSNHESYLKIDDDIEDFLGALNDAKSDKESEDDQYDDDDEDDVNEDDTDDESEEYEESKIPSIDDDTEFDSEEDIRETSRGVHNNNETKDRPYSFLELMAMS